jgi:Myb-like DNA-binding protein REB1
MDILRIKKSVYPAPPTQNSKKRKERKVTSAAAVTEPDSRDSNETTPEAGDSTQNDARDEDGDSE